MAQPIIPWIGGKRRLAQHLLPMFPTHTCYVEPFCGAAALFFLKEHSKSEVLNDINSDLVCLYRVLQHHLEEFVRQFKWSLASREMFKWAQETPPNTLTEIQRAARFYYLQRLAFGAKLEGQTFGTATLAPARLNLLRIEEELSAAHLRLNGVQVEHLPWQDCVTRYDRPHTFFYMDPPYWGTEGYGVPFGLENYERMAELLRTMKGQALVSVNDIPEMRQAFKGLQMKRLPIRYTVGASAAARREVNELVISNLRARPTAE
jgi:DNA adenine methylase